METYPGKKKKKKLSLSITEEKNYGNRNVENLEALAILRRRETCNTRPNKAHLKIGPIVTTNESSVTRANCLLFFFFRFILIKCIFLFKFLAKWPIMIPIFILNFKYLYRIYLIYVTHIGKKNI